MFRRLHPLTGLVALAVLLVACGGDSGDIEVADARSRMSPMVTGVGAAYLDVTNNADVDDALVGASVDPAVAGSVELHETFDADAHEGMDHDGDMDHGAMDDQEGFAMMGMREIDRLEIPAGATVELVPGGYHLMLIDLAEDLVPGTEYDLTLTFAEAGDIAITVEVRDDV